MLRRSPGQSRVLHASPAALSWAGAATSRRALLSEAPDCGGPWREGMLPSTVQVRQGPGLERGPLPAQEETWERSGPGPVPSLQD